MAKIREVTVFANGDSSKLATWSTLPYFFTETLMAKGVKVNRVDVSPDPRLQNIWNKTMGRYVNRFTRLTSYNYFRSLVHFKDVKKRVNQALESYPKADANIFMTFSFSSAGMTNKPTVLFCDWTYDHYFKYHVGQKPGLLERRCLKRENAQIEAADMVVSLFPGIADYMKETYTNKNIFYLGNVINSVYEVSESEALQPKKDSNDLLFVGSPKYMEGALALMEAFVNLKQQRPNLKLHIVGTEKGHFKAVPSGVMCYGYLDKGKDESRELYYELFKKAKVFINTTPKWAAFSASIEAMYFYIPVVVTAYDEFTRTFGNNIKFGAYCEENSPAVIETKIKSILDHPSYNSLCVNAHKAVQEYTWSAYIDRVIEQIEKIDLKPQVRFLASGF